MIEVQNHISLKSFQTFGFDVIAETLVMIKTKDDLIRCRRDGFFEQDYFVLGGGSNVLLTNEIIDKPIIQIGIGGIEILEEDENFALVKAGAGVNWHELVLWTINHNFSGIENLSLIPGTCGAAPMQNIGAYGVEIMQVFQQLEAFNIRTGEFEIFTKSDCEFGYRESVFKRKLKGQYIITSIQLKLNKKHRFNLSYGDVQKVLIDDFGGVINLRNVSNAIIKIRQSKLPDPKEIGNSGSFFKNPIIPLNHFQKLKELFPEIPSYPAGSDKIKVPAGWLIEKAGWKGYREGNFGVHQKQALVLVNYGGAKGMEVWNLALKIQNDINAKFGIELEPEVNIV